MSTHALLGGTALVGPTLEAVDAPTILIENGTIAAIGPRDQIQLPGGVRNQDIEGLVLAPGFIDAHVHIGFYEPGDVLRGGVTTVRDLGWPERDIFALTDRSRDPDFDGAEVLAAGPILTVAGGYPTRAAWAPRGTGLPLSDRTQARTEVRRLASAGACAIKIALEPTVGPTLDEDHVRAVADEAHEAGLKVTAHISGLGELEKAISAGVDELAHMLMSEERIPDGTIERMVERDMTIVPTLSCRFGSDRSLAVENLQRFRQAGGRTIYGTDLGNEGPGPGIDRLEVTGMMRAGFSAVDVIRSATVDSAAWLGLDDRGVLEVGRRADIVAFSSRPRTAEDLTEVAGVWRGGRRVR